MLKLDGNKIIGFHISCYNDIGKFMTILSIFSDGNSRHLFLLHEMLHFLHSFLCSISTSVHGERPTAEYAKLRKESLETQFRHALGAYGSKSPFLALYRAAIVSYYVLKLTIWQCFVHDIKKRAIKVIDRYSIYFTCHCVAYAFSFTLL